MRIVHTFWEYLFRHARPRFGVRAWFLTAAPLLSASAIIFLWLSPGGTAPQDTPGVRSDDAELGRQIFNGKGICSYCHGRDGHVDQRPSLNPETEAVIKKLAPHPPDLRNPGELRVATDRERFKLIREGHTGTGMLPDARLMDEEISNLLAYLLALRQQASMKR